jgi:hypothetical protein
MLASPQKLGATARRPATKRATGRSIPRRCASLNSSPRVAAAHAAEKRLMRNAIEPAGSNIVQSLPRRT